MIQEDREQSAGTWQQCPWGCEAKLKYTGNVKRDARARAEHWLVCEKRGK